MKLNFLFVVIYDDLLGIPKKNAIQDAYIAIKTHNYLNIINKLNYNRRLAHF